MKDVLIISTNRNRFPFPVMPYGACIVAEAAERAGYRVSVLDLMFEKRPLEAIKNELKRLNPDVIGLSIRNIDNNDIQKPVAFFKELSPVFDILKNNTDSPTVIGGPAVGVMPEELLRFTGASIAVLGDGEVVFPQILDGLSKRKDLSDISGIAWIEDNIFKKNPLNSTQKEFSPTLPDFSKWINIKPYKSFFATIPVQTKRGCPYRCIYCTYAVAEGKNYRLSDPEYIVEEIRRVSSCGIKHFEFVDNVFNSPYEHAMKICEEIARRRINASFQSLELNPLFIDDELLSVMEASGFSGIGITVESASDIVLSSLKKGFTVDDIHRALECIKRHRLPCLLIFMLGGPGETVDTVKETIRFVKNNLRPEDIAFFNIGVRIYPGTELEDIARKEGILNIPKDKMLEPVFYISSKVDLSWMVSEIRRLMTSHMNIINSDSIGSNLLPRIHWLLYLLRVRPPLWRYTPIIRRFLRLIGIDA